MASPQRPKVLLVEDDPDVALMIADYLEHALPVDVTTTGEAQEAVLVDQKDPHDIVIADILLPEVDGIQLIRRLRMQGEHAVILMSGQPTMGRAIEAMRLGCIDLLTKPFDLARLEYIVKNAVEDLTRHRRDRVRMHRLRRLTSRIIKDRRQLRERVDLICRDLVHAYRDLARKVVDNARDESGTFH